MKTIRQATLHQLQILEAIAEHGTFTRAAEELNLTQPTISQQIKRLTQNGRLTAIRATG